MGKSIRGSRDVGLIKGKNTNMRGSNTSVFLEGVVPGLHKGELSLIAGVCLEAYGGGIQMLGGREPLCV